MDGSTPQERVRGKATLAMLGGGGFGAASMYSAVSGASRGLPPMLAGNRMYAGVGAAAVGTALGAGLVMGGIASKAYDPNRSPLERLGGATWRGAWGGALLGAAGTPITMASLARNEMPRMRGAHGNIEAARVQELDRLNQNPIKVAGERLKPRLNANGQLEHVDARTGQAFEGPRSWQSAEHARLKVPHEVPALESSMLRKESWKWMAKSENLGKWGRVALHRGAIGAGVMGAIGLVVGLHGAVTQPADRMYSNTAMY